jgi:hypothetical protein
LGARRRALGIEWQLLHFEEIIVSVPPSATIKPPTRNILFAAALAVVVLGTHGPRSKKAIELTFADTMDWVKGRTQETRNGKYSR